MLFCIPAGLAVLYAFHRYLKRPLVLLMPRAVRAKLWPHCGPYPLLPRRRLAWICALIFLGAVTHVVWDGFTHEDGWAVRHYPQMQAVIFTVAGQECTLRPAPIRKQFPRPGTVGLVVVAMVSPGPGRRPPAESAFLRRARPAIVAAMIAFGAAVGIVCGLNYACKLPGPFDIREFMAAAFITGVDAFGLSLLVFVASSQGSRWEVPSRLRQPCAELPHSIGLAIMGLSALYPEFPLKLLEEPYGDLDIPPLLPDNLAGHGLRVARPFRLRGAGRSIPVETPEQRAARMKWFAEARFGLFIHWGVYSVPAGEWKGKTNYGEWFLEETHMPVSQYEKFAQQFNPVKFDAKQWVALAKEAGMKYIVITSKHHDGFGMFPSQETDWCIKSTPFQRDPLKELSAACREAGIKFCLYHSIMDWHHPDWGTRRAWNDKATGKPDMDRYTAYMKRQLKELVTNYGPLGILWFDGEWESPWTHRARRRSLCLLPRPAARHHRQQPRGQGPRRHGRHGQGQGAGRLRHARAERAGQRFRAGRLLGIVHDDERPLGLQQARQQLEIDRGTDPHPGRLLQQGRQLPAQRRPDLRRADPRAERRAAEGHRRVDEGQRREHLRHDRQHDRQAEVGPLDDQGRHDLSARLRLAEGRQARRSRSWPSR